MVWRQNLSLSPSNHSWVADQSAKQELLAPFPIHHLNIVKGQISHRLS